VIVIRASVLPVSECCFGCSADGLQIAICTLLNPSACDQGLKGCLQTVLSTSSVLLLLTRVRVSSTACVLLLCTAGAAWTSLEFLSYVLARGWFIHLLEGNPKLAGQREKQERTAIQMCPRLVCFVHNLLQVGMLSEGFARGLACSRSLWTQAQG
jgi:hypothetical protein